MSISYWILIHIRLTVLVQFDTAPNQTLVTLIVEGTQHSLSITSSSTNTPIALYFDQKTKSYTASNPSSPLFAIAAEEDPRA
ncbi:uncharacterized protein DFL_004325 [Arthrobotrys flagrans]|uniref:Uncharacterized protein n=1 Tax=Arthrobotrys flagrans TaxID=97331 RepID=A0A437A4K0_ARTFL|nr:hypothetical protein DFL_004325 [Arthrobotrys flagrans]